VSARTNISWTDRTWNPVTGCRKISPGCTRCYAERLSERLARMGSAKYARGFEPTLHPSSLSEPGRWRTASRIFTCSMSDLFHPAVPAEYISTVLGVMHGTPIHTYQILTKRPERAASLDLPWPRNAWVGVSVESSAYYSRIEALRRIPAAVRFLSLEPLLERLPAIPLDEIDWIIVGGESGPGARPMDLDWARELRDQALARGIPYHLKQIGGVRPGSGGRELDGRTWDQYPDIRGSRS